MEEFFEELSEFARENRKALNPAIQWLNNEFDGELEDVWISAVNPFDWRKVVFIAWLGSDEKIYECKLEIDGFDLRQWCGCDRKEEDIELTPQQNFLYGVISRVEGGYYTTPKNPSFYLIRRALNEGRKAVALPADTEQPVEIKKGDVWTFIFLGETVSVDGRLKGLKLLEVLLTNPGKYYNPLDLLKEAGLESQGTTASELIYEQKDQRAISKNIGELEIAYDKKQDPAEKMEIKEDIEKAMKILSNATNKCGKSRSMSDKYRIRVSSLIKKVLSKIAPNSPNLHNHFKAFLKFGMENTYKPDKKIVCSIK